MTKIKIKRAIVSVYDKSYLNILADYFVENNIEVLSTGGTSKFLKSLNNQIKIVDISEFTKSDEILDGRVKTLHPMIHSGILAQKNNPSHLTQIKKIKVPPIDLVVVNLYPFESVFQKKGVSEEECIENIDIGGPTMIRAAAKNFQNVTVLTDPKNYLEFVSEVMINNNAISSESRKKFAKLAFENTSYYEGLISNWFNKNNGEVCENKTSLPIEKISKLRYGENPHQKGTLFKFGKNKFTKLSGKDLSFNNIFDLEIAMELAEQFSKPSCVILKHGNPCGVALDKNQDKAYLKAYKCDKVSAFGGVVAFNKGVTAKTAKEINKIFTEIVIAPEFSSESIKYLSLKKNLILIRYRAARKPTNFR